MSRPVFSELITPFLREKLESTALRFGRASRQHQALARQYLRSDEEDISAAETNVRHYEAEVGLRIRDQSLPGVERLYRRTLVIEPTLACAAHCRFCIRANYPRHNLNEDQLVEIARYCGSSANRDDLNEVLITGGDVLLVPGRVEFLLRAIIEHAPNIRIARIASRIPVQDPKRINDDVLRLFRGKPTLRLELATQVNHAVELFPEVVEAYGRIMETGARVYAQNVLLRGVNDDVDDLVALYDALRHIGIEAHYLFHCVPLQGMAHHRIPLQSAIDLASAITNSGQLSGRAKPLAAAMTDIGKIVLYDGVIVRREGRRILLQSSFRIEDRLRWNPNWTAPRSADIGSDGRLRVWYLDGARHSADRRAVARSRLTAPYQPSVALPLLHAAS